MCRGQRSFKLEERTAAELTFTMTPAIFPLELLLYQNGAVIATGQPQGHRLTLQLSQMTPAMYEVGLELLINNNFSLLLQLPKFRVEICKI